MKSPGKFGEFGGVFVPETLIPALEQLEKAFLRLKDDKKFISEFNDLLENYAGRPTALTFCNNLSKKLGCRLYLKREDLLHSGAHKINNALGQALLARFIGKKRLIAETGAGQHGVAVATAGAKLGFHVDIYMGSKDIERQKLNVLRMNLLGANVIPVDNGPKTLKDAINEALRDWTANVESTHYLLGSALGPHPFPSIVKYFQSVIGRESKKQIIELEGRLPDIIAACVGGGSNAIGIFNEFINDLNVKLIGVEAGGQGISTGNHAARFSAEKIGIIHGTKTYVLQDNYGQIQNTSSIAAGLDYCAVGPEHSFFRDNKRIEYDYATDEDVLEAFKMLSREEGIIPALESAHAIAHLFRMNVKDKLVIVNLSGRGDKDLEQIEGMI